MKKSLKNLILISFLPACISASGCNEGESSKDIEGISSKNTSNSLQNERADNELSNNLSKNAGKESGKNFQKKDENGQIADRINGNKDEENLNSEFNTTSSESLDAYIEKKSESNSVSNNRARDNEENKEERGEGSEKIIEESEKSKDRYLEEDLKKAIEEGEKKIIELQNRSKNTNIDNCNDDNSEVVEENENIEYVYVDNELEANKQENFYREICFREIDQADKKHKKVIQELVFIFNTRIDKINEYRFCEIDSELLNPSYEFLDKLKNKFVNNNVLFWKYFIRNFKFLFNVAKEYEKWKKDSDYFLRIAYILGSELLYDKLSQCVRLLSYVFIDGLDKPEYEKKRRDLLSEIAKISNEEGFKK